MFFFSFFAFFWGENGFLTSSAHNRTAAHALWQMAGGADQRLHMWGFQGGVGGGEGEGGLWGGGDQSSAHLHSITLFPYQTLRRKSACTRQCRDGW